jgi:hypothetical protein
VSRSRTRTGAAAGTADGAAAVTFPDASGQRYGLPM